MYRLKVCYYYLIILILHWQCWNKFKWQKTYGYFYNDGIGSEYLEYEKKIKEYWNNQKKKKSKYII